MSLANILLADNEKFKFITAKFQPFENQKTAYTYKTMLDLKVEDLVVVQTPDGKFEAVRVEEVLEAHEVDLEAFDYKWVVQKLDTEHFDQCKEMEKQLLNTLRKSERRQRIEEMKKNVVEHLTDEERNITAKLVRL